MSKKLNIIEAMKMPIGTKFNFNLKTNNAEFIEVVEGEKEPKILCWDGDKNTQVRVSSSTSEIKLTVIQQPVNFMEAIANEYNRVRVDLTGLNFYSKAKENLNKYMSVKEMFKALYMHFSDYGISQAIKEGKWYIEESEDYSNE